MSQQKVVLDTNIILVSLYNKSPYHWVFEKLQNEEFILCVTTEIILEYSEIIGNNMGKAYIEIFENFLDGLTNIQFLKTYYQFNLLEDPDNNKFVDCAVAANASYLVSHDKDFKKLAQIDFPKVEVINISEFKRRLSE